MRHWTDHHSQTLPWFWLLPKVLTWRIHDPVKYIRKSKHQTLILYHKLILSWTNQNQISTLLTNSTQISLTKLKHAQRELIFLVYICLQGASKADLINITTEDMKIERFLRQTTSKCFHMNLLRVHKEDRFLKKSLTDFSFCDWKPSKHHWRCCW